MRTALPSLLAAVLLAAVVLGACASSPPASPAPSPTPAADVAPGTDAGAATPIARAQRIIAAADRDAADKALDAGRKPAKLLELIWARPGMRIGEVAAGGGYTTELLARAVGPAGVVYGQNSPMILQRFAEKPWSARLAKPVNAQVKRLDTEFDAPFPPDVKDLDVVVNVLFYHDTVWIGTDRARMNKNIFDALKPGGIYVVVDHSGREGTGATEVQTLHRIEEKLVKDEILAAGFVLVDEGTFLKNPADARDWNASPREAGERRGESDRFVLKFQKPE